MPISSGVRAIHGVFGTMLDTAVEVGRGAAAMWSAYTAGYASIGVDRPPANLQDMNTYVSWLGTVVGSVNAIRAASEDTILAASHIAPPLGFQSSPADYAAPSIVATFKVSITTEEGEIERWSSVAYNNVFPTTIGQLKDEALASVQSQLDQSATEEGDPSPTAGGTATGIGDMYVIGYGL